MDPQTVLIVTGLFFYAITIGFVILLNTKLKP